MPTAAGTRYLDPVALVRLRNMGLAARLIARTAQDLIENPEIIDEARIELERKRGADFEYEALLGDREPPLDYRL